MQNTGPLIITFHLLLICESYGVFTKHVCVICVTWRDYAKHCRMDADGPEVPKNRSFAIFPKTKGFPEAGPGKRLPDL